MSLRNRVNPQQLLAVSFALIMLVSMGGMAFVGGAGAQTGGTLDQVIEQSENAGDDLNVANDEVQLVGLDDNGNVDNVEVNPDGSIEVSANGASAGQFSGVSVAPERVDELFGVEASVDDPADFLVESTDTFSAESGGSAAPVIFAEYDPQSEFSQISNVDGSHDAIVVAPNSSIAGSLVAEEELSGVTQGNVVAVSITNDGTGQLSGDDVSVLADDTDHGAVLDSIVGQNTADLQNENIDDYHFAGGVFGDQAETITALNLDDGEGERFIHSERITLNPEGNSDRVDFEFYPSVTEAVAAADTEAGDVITVADGTYDDTNGAALEDAPITVGAASNLEIVGENNPTLGVGVTVADTSSNVTIDGVTVEDADVTLNGDDPTVLNSTVNASANAITVGDVAGEVTIEGNDLNAANTDLVSTGDIGLDLQAPDNATVTDNSFDGFATQVNNPGANVNATELRDNNEFEQLAVAVNETDQVVSDAGGNLYGSIIQADDGGAVGNTIAVYDGTYDHGETAVAIDADDVTLEDVDGSATIVNNLNIVGSSGDVSVDGFVVEGTFAATSTNPSTLNVTDTDVATEGGSFDVDSIATVNFEGTAGDDYTVTGATNVTVTDADGDTFDITATNDVVVDGALVTPATGDANGIFIDRTNSNDAGDITVQNSEVEFDTSAEQPDISTTGVNVDTALDGGIEETVTVTNVTVSPTEEVDPENSDTYTPTGIAVTNIDTAPTNNEYDVSGNTLTGLGNGVGVDVVETENAGTQNIEDELGILRVDDNEIRGGSNFIGIHYDLPVSIRASLTNNEIVGADVAGGDDSVGVEFDEVSDFGGGGVLSEGQTMTFEDNVITGHAQLVADVSTDEHTLLGSDYSAIYNSSELNNELGTIVVGADGATYTETYGGGQTLYNGDEGATPRTYLPGSVSEAVNLLEQNPDKTSADLVVTDPGVSTTDVPDTYDDEAVDFADFSEISIEGETADVTVETTFDIDESTAENNHSITDLTIVDAVAGNPAIDVSSENAQSDFDNLDITSDDTAIDVTTSGNDVNVINVTNSDINVTEGTNGIVLDNGASDDRDGFTIHNVDIDGPGIDAADSVGLDLTGVEKPGKDGLRVNLTVTNNDVGDFETLVALDNAGDAGSQIAGVNAQAFLDDEGVDDPQISVQDNTFDRAVVVTDGTGVDDSSSDDLFGSVDKADEGANANNVITVYNLGDAFYDHGGEVTIATEGVTVTGPTDGAGAADRTEEVVIQDPLAVSGSGSVTIDGLAVVPNDADAFSADFDGYSDAVANTQTAVIGYTGAGDLTVQDTSVSTALDSSEHAMPVGIGATDAASSLTVDDTFVGDHDDGTTTGSGIVAESDVTFTLTDSVLTGGVDTTADEENTQAFGVLAASVTAPEISGTDITNFDQAGVNTEASDETVLTLTAGETLTITGDELEAKGAIDNQSATGDYSTEFDGSAGDGFVVVENQLNPDDFGVEFTFELEEDYLVENGSVENPGENITIDQLVLTRTSDADAGSDYGDRPTDQYELIGVDSATGNTTNFDNEETDEDIIAVDSAPTGLTTALDEVNAFVTETDVGVEAFQIDLTQEQGVGSISRVTISDTNIIEPTDARALRVTNGDISDNGDAGIETNGQINAADKQYQVDDTTIDNNGDTGVDLQEVGLDLANGAAVTNNADGVVVDALDTADITVDISGVEISDNTNDGVALDVNDANIENNLIEANDVGLDVALDAESTITQNDIAANAVGLDVGATSDADLTVEANDFSSTETDIASDDGGTFDATLNYFNDQQGPSGANAAGVDDNVVYDPFLTESFEDVEDADNIGQTTSFGHDVVIPEDETVSVGIPAQPEGDRNTVSDVFSEDTKGSLYEFNPETQEFEYVSPSEFDEEVEAFDGYVVDNTGGDTVAKIEYQSSRSPVDTPANAFEFQEGLNFVPPTQAGQVNDVLFPGADTDFVGQPFSTGENLYGVGGNQAQGDFANPSADGFGENFRGDAGTQRVHPHAAYLVIVNDAGNEGLTVVEQIPAPDAPTVDDIQERTDEDDET